MPSDLQVSKFSGKNASTPCLPSMNTGGPDPTVGKGNPAFPAPGVIAGPLTGEAEAPGGGSYGGTDPSAGKGNPQIDGTIGVTALGISQGVGGMGPDLLSFANSNADSSGRTSMQDMSGPHNGVSPKPLNTDRGRTGDSTETPLSKYV